MSSFTPNSFVGSSRCAQRQLVFSSLKTKQLSSCTVHTFVASTFYELRQCTVSKPPVRAAE